MNRVFLMLCLTFAMQGYLAAQQICIDPVAKKDKNSSVQHGVSSFSRKWNNGATIKVKFLNGDDYVKGKVKQYVPEWSQYANIKFVFVESGNADVHVSFTPGGSWSQIGTDATRISQSDPTLNLGWLTRSTPETEFRRTILHEFGHVLGLVHEHLSPDSNIHWNKPKVYAYYMQVEGWTKEMVDENIFNRYSVTQSNHQYDSKSIMHYPIPADWTTDGFSVGWNTDLSPGDKEYIAELYPKSPDPDFATTTSNKPNTNTAPVSTPTAAGQRMTCALGNIQIEHNLMQGGKMGLKIYSTFRVNDGADKNCLYAAYFYTADGKPLKDKNMQYYSSDGNVATSINFTPKWAQTDFTKLDLFIPYEELHTGFGEFKLKFYVSIWDDQMHEVVKSGAYYFDYWNGAAVDKINATSILDDAQQLVFIKPAFGVRHAKGEKLRACAYFYDINGKPLKDTNQLFFTSDGNVSTFADLTPAYDNTVYNINNDGKDDFYLNIPYKELHLPKGLNTVKYFVTLWEGGREVCKSGWGTFNITMH